LSLSLSDIQDYLFFLDQVGKGILFAESQAYIQKNSLEGLVQLL